MANTIGRLKSKEASDSPIHGKMENFPLRENQPLQYLPATTYSRADSPQRYVTGSAGPSTAPSTRTQSTNSPRDRFHTKERFRQVTRDLLDQSSAQQVPDMYTRVDPPKFDPSEIEGMDFPHLPPDSEYDDVEGLLDSMTFRENQRGTVWPSVPEETYDAEQYDTGFRMPVGRTETRQMGNVPQSKSEGHIKSCLKQSRDDDPYVNDPYVNAPYAYYYEPPMGGQQSPPERANSPGRGRAREKEKVRSPVRFSDNVDEHDPIPFLKSPTRRSRSPHKKLFGENGWLGRSTSMKELPAEKYKKPAFKNFGEKIKQRVGDFTGDMMRANANIFNSESNNSKIVSQSTFPISLDPPTQAKLLAEMEVMICVTANKFLLLQYEEGRMSVESVAKVTSFWASKNRPQVLEFQFDQATQRDLILYNIKSFRFFGEAATNVIVLNGTLYNWKAVAKEMSIRTFCTPDSVIRKHMHDTHKILEMLGAPLVTFLAFQELQVKTLATIKEEQRKKFQRSKDHGVTKEYVPQSLLEAEAAEAAAENARNTY